MPLGLVACVASTGAQKAACARGGSELKNSSSCVAQSCSTVASRHRALALGARLLLLAISNSTLACASSARNSLSAQHYL